MEPSRAPKDTVARLLDECQIYAIEDLDLLRIADHLGVVVRYLRLEGCAANIVGYGDHAIIAVDRNASAGRKQFSVGHELGHWVYDRGKGLYLCSNHDLSVPWGQKAQKLLKERRANQFAAELLMPTAWFQTAVRGKCVSFETVQELRERFRASRTSMALRLIELTDQVAMLIKYDLQGRRVWFASSRDFPSRLFPVQAMARDGHVWDALNAARSYTSGTDEVDGDAWLDHRSACDITMTESALRVRDGMFVLIHIDDHLALADMLSERERY